MKKNVNYGWGLRVGMGLLRFDLYLKLWHLWPKNHGFTHTHVTPYSAHRGEASTGKAVGQSRQGLYLVSARTFERLEGHPFMAPDFYLSYPHMLHASRRQFTILPRMSHTSVMHNASLTSFLRSGSCSDMLISSLPSLQRSWFVTNTCCI